MASIAEIPRMKATTLTVMATRGEDQDLVFQTAAPVEATKSVTTSRKKERILPCFGWHPWFSHQIFDDEGTRKDEDDPFMTTQLKQAHYEKVLTPSPDDETFIFALPDPKPLSHLISETRTRLLAHPTALVGEVGLDRAFRLPNAWTKQEVQSRDATMTPGSREGRSLSPYRVQLDHQKTVLRAQLQLAGELSRPVSVHSVQAHGAVFDLLKELWSGHERKVLSRRERKQRDAERSQRGEADEEDEEKEASSKTNATPFPFPSRICMHSYSGPVDPVRQFLDPSNPSDVYFSFSSLINFSGPSSQKVIQVIKALPDDRVLIESDLHTAGKQMDDLLEEVARQVCDVRGWDLRKGVQQLADNWRRFVYGSSEVLPNGHDVLNKR
ncbi:hypothetical protein AWENTII_001542 [Aspergillus wentii]